MASLLDSIKEIRKQSNDIAETYNNNLKDKDLGTLINNFIADAPQIHVPNQDEWIRFFAKFKDNSWNILKEETVNLGKELLDTVTSNYKGFLDGYKQWKSNLQSFVGADSFDDLYNKYQQAIYGTLESDPKIIINNNEFERNDTGISLDYDKLGSSVDDYVLRTNNATSATKAVNKRTRSRSINEYLNKNVGALLLSGPDLQKNMFDVFLIYHGGEDDGDSTQFVMFCAPTENPIKDDDSSGESVSTESFNLSAPLQSLIEDVYMLTVRTQSVEVPGRTRNSGKWNWIGAGVDVAQSDWDYKPVSSITVDLDANLYVYDIFNALSGFVRPGTYGSGHYYSDPSERPVDKDNLYRVLAPAKLGGVKHTMDLCVPIHKLSTYVDGKVGYSNLGADILYVFEDVRFLGIADPITFNNESAARQSVNVPFIFKNIRTVYRTDMSNMQEEKEVSKFSKEMQKFIFDNAASPEGLIGG